MEYRITFENGVTAWYEGKYIDALNYAESMATVYDYFTIEENAED